MLFSTYISYIQYVLETSGALIYIGPENLHALLLIEDISFNFITGTFLGKIYILGGGGLLCWDSNLCCETSVKTLLIGGCWRRDVNGDFTR